MSLLEIVRTEKLETCTRGRVILDGVEVAVSLELPFRDNQTNVSCIPVGDYECVPYKSSKFGNVFKVLNVKDRTDILIHAGNTAKDTLGCILVGTKFGLFEGEPAVLESKKALGKLREKLGNKPFKLIIREMAP